MVPPDSYAVPLAYAIGSVLVALIICLVCHRRLRRRPRHGIPTNELPQRIVDDRHHCYHHHELLHHHQEHPPHGFNQYQLEEPSPLSETDDEMEPEEEEQGCEQETSSPDSV